MVRVSSSCDSSLRGTLCLESLDGPVIRNANRGDLRESMRTNRFAEKPYFHDVRAIRANRLKPAIRNF